LNILNLPFIIKIKTLSKNNSLPKASDLFSQLILFNSSGVLRFIKDNNLSSIKLAIELISFKSKSCIFIFSSSSLATAIKVEILKLLDFLFYLNINLPFKISPTCTSSTSSGIIIIPFALLMVTN